MADDGEDVLNISSLINRGRPLTAASSLIPGGVASSSKFHPVYDRKRRREPYFSDIRTLKPLGHPLVLVGTVTLPFFADGISKCSFFQFADHSATVCCDILDFDLRMIGQKIKALVWNFLPINCSEQDIKGGFLEIIRWEFFQDCPVNTCCLVGLNSLCLHSSAHVDVDKPEIGRTFFGVIESISPVSTVPCSGSTKLTGFLVNVLVCVCKSCSSKTFESKRKYLHEKNAKGHSFVKNVIVYFCGLASTWHPAVSRYIGHVILLNGLKKKQVLISKGVSQVMFVTANGVSLHLTVLCRKQGEVQDRSVTGTGEMVTYTGVVTGLYMQGLIAELDKDVMLILTDQFDNVPHSMRVGSIVTVKHCHLVAPRFLWGKLLILGACCRTTLCVESFSPFKTKCYLKSHSRTLLHKFVDSLTYAAKLWVLLLDSCLRKKFEGILPEKDILGSDYKEGLAIKYARFHLPESAFQIRHGLLVKFCKPDLCFIDNGTDCSNLRLVPPIAALINYCEALWKNILDGSEKFSDSMPSTNNGKLVTYNQRSDVEPTRRVLLSEEIGVLIMGTLRTSEFSGRLHLVDATGEIDIILESLRFGNMNKVYEVKDFKIIIERMPLKMVNADFTSEQPFSCRSIFGNHLPRKPMEMTVYLHGYEDSRSCSFMFNRRNFIELRQGTFHLLLVTHKFPFHGELKGDEAKVSEVYAEASVLPWNLVVDKCECNVRSKGASSHPSTNLPAFKNCSTIQKLKASQNSSDACCCSLNDAEYGYRAICASTSSCSNLSTKNPTSVFGRPIELPCLIVEKQLESCFSGKISCISAHAKIVSACEPLQRKVLLKFAPDAFSTYTVLRIGHCYLVKHEDGDVLCPTEESIHASRPNLLTPGTHIWSAAFSFTGGCKSSLPMGHHKFKNSCSTSFEPGFEALSDVKICLAPCALNHLENVINTLDGRILDPRDSLGEKLDVSNSSTSLIQASETLPSSCRFPEGSLITLHGTVVTFYPCNGDALAAVHGLGPHDGLLRLLHKSNDLCVLLLEDHRMVQIFCNLSKQAYPVGFGRNAHASFHRILALGEMNKYMTIPSSFIAIKFPDMSNTADESKHTSPQAVSSVLIYDALKLPKLDQLQLCCRVVRVCLLVMEEAKTTEAFESSLHAFSSTIRIPLACFLIDDGSATCFCWADSERATTLLELDLEEDSGKSVVGPSPSQLKDILKQHGRVVVRSGEFFSGSSYRGLMLSTSTGASISSSHEEVLTSIFTRASLSKAWTVIGKAVDQKRAMQLAEKLADLELQQPPLMNIWATSVSQRDALSGARDIIGQLL